MEARWLRSCFSKALRPPIGSCAYTRFLAIPCTGSDHLHGLPSKYYLICSRLHRLPCGRGLSQPMYDMFLEVTQPFATTPTQVSYKKITLSTTKTGLSKLLYQNIGYLPRRGGGYSSLGNLPAKKLFIGSKQYPPPASVSLIYQPPIPS